MANYSEPSPSIRYQSIFLGSQYTVDNMGTLGMSFANCTMEPVFVECKASCTGRTCAVTKMRRAQPPDTKSAFWANDLMSGYTTDYFDGFSQELPFATPGMFSQYSQSTPTEVYLSGEESYPYSSSGQVRLYE